MKIAIIGFSGSGKSTLAHAISKKHSLPLLHLDKAHWLPNWVERDKGEREEIVKDFLDAREKILGNNRYKMQIKILTEKGEPGCVGKVELYSKKRLIHRATLKVKQKEGEEGKIIFWSFDNNEK